MQFMSIRIKLTRTLYLFISIFIVGIFSPCIINAEQNSFNVLFPETWYEKGLNSTISVWHTIFSFLDDKPEVQPLELFDIMLGKCAFARFCFEMMYESKQFIIDEDIEYLEMLLHKLEKQLEKYEVKGIRRDKISCLLNMITVMKNSLQIPCDI